MLPGAVEMELTKVGLPFELPQRRREAGTHLRDDMRGLLPGKIFLVVKASSVKAELRL